MREAELLNEVLRLADKHNVLAFHCFDSRQTVGAGFPDIVLSGLCRTVFAELKVDDKSKGYLKPEQREWKARLEAGNEEWYLLRPADLHSGDIEQLIEGLNCDE